MLREKIISPRKAQVLGRRDHVNGGKMPGDNVFRTVMRAVRQQDLKCAAARMGIKALQCIDYKVFRLIADNQNTDIRRIVVLKNRIDSMTCDTQQRRNFR